MLKVAVTSQNTSCHMALTQINATLPQDTHKGKATKQKTKRLLFLLLIQQNPTHTQKHTSMQNLHTGSFYKTAGISVPLHPPFHKEDEHNKQYETAGMFHIVYHVVPVNWQVKWDIGPEAAGTKLAEEEFFLFVWDFFLCVSVMQVVCTLSMAGACVDTACSTSFEPSLPFISYHQWRNEMSVNVFTYALCPQHTGYNFDDLNYFWVLYMFLNL